MKKLLGLLVVVLAIPLVGTPRAADIDGLAWNQSNIATLRSSSKADVVRMFNEQRSKSRVPLPPLTEAEIGQFRWVDLAGNGTYQLVTTSSYPCAKFVEVDDRDASGKIRMVQTIGGWANLKTGISDLNGDGRDELIIAKPLVEYSCAAVATWTAVYRLENGKYVEASRDFPKFYDEQVLPGLEERITDYQSRLGQDCRHQIAAASLERDKILRVLGRNPAAGLNQAHQWMNTDDPSLLLDAEVTLKEIGGHQEEARVAELAYTRAECERHPAMVKCRNLPQGWRSESALSGESDRSVEGSCGGAPAPSTVVREVPPGHDALPIHPGGAQ